MLKFEWFLVECWQQIKRYIYIYTPREFAQSWLTHCIYNFKMS